MARDRRGMPRTQTSAPAQPRRTAQEPSDRPPPTAPRIDERPPARREAGDEGEVRGDRMPPGADEPGAGL